MSVDNISQGIFRLRLENIPFTATAAANIVPDDVSGSTVYKYATNGLVDIPVHEITWNVNPTFIENADELRGLAAMPWHDGVGQMAVEITAKARVRPKMLTYLCFLLAGDKYPTDSTSPYTEPCTIVGQDGTPPDDHAGTGVNPLKQGTWQHHFKWLTGTDIPKTCSIFFAPVRGPGWKCGGAGLTTLAFSFEDSGALVADMVFRGLYFEKVVDGSNSSTLDVDGVDWETDVPLKRGNFAFVGDNIFSNAQSKAQDVTLNFENGLTNFFSFGVASEWPDSIEYEELWPRISGSVTKRQLSAADYTRWITNGADITNGAFQECVQGIGAALSGVTTKFAFYVHMPKVQYLAMNPEAITNKRRVGVSFDWEARSDPAVAGAYCDLYVVSKVDPANLVTFP